MMCNITRHTLLFLALCCIFVAVPVCAQDTPLQNATAASEPEKLSAAFYYNRANYAISREMYAEALDEINKGLDLDPAFLPFIMQKALVLSRMSRHDEATRYYSLALQAKPADARLAALAVENLQGKNKNDAAGLSADLDSVVTRLSKI